MSKKPNIGAVISLDGEKEYRAAISNITKAQSVLKSEMKALSAEYEGNANSIEALRAKNELLRRQQAEEEKRLSTLRGALQDASKQYGENSKQAQNWQIKMNNAYAELTKLNKEINENEKYMKEAEQSTDKTAKSIDEYGKEVKKAKEETLTFGDVLKANLASDFIITGIKSVVGGIKDIISSTEEYRKDFSILEANANAAGESVGGVSEQLKILDALTQETDSNVEALSNLLEAGFKGNSLAEAVEILSGAVIKFPDTLKIESLADSLQETLATGKATGQFAELLERLGYNIDMVNASMEKSVNYTERQQYAMDLLANTGLAKVNEEYVKNNQSMIEYYNAQFELREVMSQIAVATLPLFSKAMGVLSDNVEDIADKALPPVIDGFSWMIENADTIEVSLKAIGAALITKKAADGITYAITAYKTLTIATEAATTAQIAYNTASKASVIGAIASVVVGLGTALYTYAQNAKEAAEATNEITDGIKRNIEERDQATKSIEKEVGSIRTLTDNLYTLADRENKSNTEKQQMVALVEQLNKQMPNLNLSIDEQTGLINKNRQEVEQLTEAYLQQIKVQAAKDNLTKIGTDLYDEEQNLIVLERKRKEVEESIKNANEGLSRITNSMQANQWYKDIKPLNDELKSLNNQIEDSKQNIKEAEDQWNEAMKYIGDHSSIDETSKSLDTFASKFKAALEAQTDSEIGSLEYRFTIINKLYSQSQKALENRLKEEKKAIEKAQKERVDSVKKATESELKILETAHKKKIELINEEYLEKLKNTDEDRYNALKKIQDQIDGINNQSEAEDRALRLREESEKKAELQSRIESAKTAEEKLEAQNELKEYEEELSRERLRTERKLQIDILEEQKKTINETYDSKVEALKKAEEAEIEKANTQYQNDKQAIQDRLNLKLEELELIKEKENESFQERQEEYKEYLREQKELATKNAKEIYEEDLRQFKLNNALKYENTIKSEQEMMNTMKQYAAESMMKGVNTENALKILQSSNINEMSRYYDPSTLNTNNNSQPLDYGMFTDAMEKALKKTNLKVVVGEKEIGKIIDDRIMYTIN